MSWSKEYYQKNKERIKARTRKYNKANLEKVRKWKKKYREKIKERITKYKLKKGCKICSYNKCPDALEFHHLDKDKKIFGISVQHFYYSWKKILKEIKKCILLCSNCHKELHYKLRNKNKQK